MKYRLVPVEPTREMWAAAGDAVVALNSQHHDAISEAVYKAMLTASPDVEQNPAPDVSVLVGVLEEMIDVARAVDSWESFPSAPIDRAQDALGTYRKQRG